MENKKIESIYKIKKDFITIKLLNLSAHNEL